MEELADLLGESPAIKAVREKLRQLLERQPAGRRLPAILIQGETGTGKGLVARLMHRMGPRRGGPFVDINCPAIPETLFEAELFGYERGAFTDARHAKPGLLQTANRGTLFLDEVGLLPDSAQAKLLTVIEDGVVRRLGSTRPEAVDVCFVSATNTDLQEALRARRFREDLYHRLAVITLDLPPLRERGRDVLLLAERFLDRACVDYELPRKILNEQARARLLAYRWPGNVRELANVMERAALFADSPVVTAAMLEPLSVEGPYPPGREPSSRAGAVTPEEAMRQHLLGVLAQCAGNISHAAARLGIARNTLYARLGKYGVRGDRPSSRRPGQPETVQASTLTGPGLQWERRGITLLCAALVELDAGAAGAHTSRALEVVTDKLQTFGGRVEELTPTRVTASFGVDPVDDAPRRAAHAAMAIQKRAERAREAKSRTPGLKIGIHVAQVLVGRSASRLDIDADAQRAQGPLLDQLLQTIGTDETVASAAAAPFLERRFELVPIDGGAGGPDQVYRLTGQERRGWGLWGAMTKFVGRHAEIEVLRDRLAAAVHGRGQLVDVVGEPGVGKSRLLWEVTHPLHVDGWLVLEVGAVPYGKITPYLPVIDLLKIYCGIAERDDQRTTREKVIGKLLALDREFEVAQPVFLTLLDVPVDDAEWQGLDPAERRRRTLDAVKGLLLRESQVQPLALVFEDLQWIDGETQALLDSLVESLPGARLMLLVSHRSEYAHAWGSQTSYTQLRIDPLPRESAEALLDVLLGNDPGLDTLKRLLIERTEGNPLFVEESVRALVETGTLTGERGKYRLAHDLPAIHVPGTVQAILTARIDRLPPEEKRLLEIAAVIGKDFPLALLLAVAGEKDGTVRRGLGQLQTAEFLYETRVFPDLEYTFKHALTHEVAYGSLFHGRRRDLHARIVETIERLYGDRLGEQTERLAHHAVRGELWDHAVRYLRQAGTKAAERSALRESVTWFEQALIALSNRAQSRERLEKAIDIRLELRGSLFALGEFDHLLENLRAAETAAEALGDPRRRGWVSCFLASYFWATGSPERAIAPAQAARLAGESLADLSLQVSASYFQGLAHYSQGEYGRAIDLFTRICGALKGERIHERCGQPGLPAVFARTWLAFCRAERGEFDEAVDTAREGMAIAEAANQPYTLTVAYWAVGDAHLKKGELTDAIRALERGLQLSRKWNFRGLLPGIADLLGHAYALSASIPAAVALLEEMEEQSRGIRHPRSLSLVHLSEAYRGVGRIEEAVRVALRALALSREWGERGNEAWALRLIAENAAHRDDSETAEDHYRLALALATDLEMRPLVAHCHLGLGKLYRRAVKRQEAQEHLASATTMYRDMDMPFWLEQAEEERKVSAGESLRSSTASGSTPARPL
jgi:DNA-binding NtrC family response regulator/tetratricopeptide (TPR) repeat protein